jgi:trimeric autotransporter adhesin
MASTYSSLKIQLMGTGENSGTWGNVTNVNLGTAIEEAIVGSADVTFASGTVTLALTDANSSQIARNLRLNLTGTSGGAQNLVVPAIEKVYIVNNGCADTITIKNNTGAGIAVPAGKTMYVYNTGSNVVDAITHLTSLTLGTPLANNQTTASASNGASTIVARDAGGNFAANTISANLSGTNVGATTVTATNVTATNFTTTNFTITESGGSLLIKNGSTTIITISASGAITAAGDITSTS